MNQLAEHYPLRHLWPYLALSILIHGAAFCPYKSRQPAENTKTLQAISASISSRSKAPRFRLTDAKAKSPKKASQRPLPDSSQVMSYTDPDATDQSAHVIDVPNLPAPDDESMEPGMAKIRVMVNSFGAVDDVEILESSLSESYTTALVSTFRLATFSPAILHGKAVSSWRIIEILYGMSDSDNKEP